MVIEIATILDKSLRESILNFSIHGSNVFITFSNFWAPS